MTIDEFSDRISEKGIKILQKKMANINAPTNSDKLLLPFDILGVNLNDEDKRIIRNRNTFLHGRITIYPDKEKEKLEGVDMELYFITLKLFFLNTALLLRHVGFSGYIVNHCKIHFRNKESIKAEDFYRKV